MRLISICPSNTELLHYLGLTHMLVGVDDFSDWPKEIQNLPKLGPDLQIDMDKVEKLEPDLVLASLSVPGMEKNIEELKKRNIPYIVLNPQSLKDIEKDLLSLGKITNTKAKAMEVTDCMNELIHTYKELAATIPSKTKVYWEWWPKPVFTPGKINWLTEISELAGATNVFADKNVASHQTDWEEVAEKNPDVICMIWVGVKESKMKPAHVKKRPGWEENVAAVKENKIFCLEEALFCRPSPRLLHGLKKVAHLLHPDIYPTNTKDDPLL
ncbi:ABC transporter substrate-binding protein [Sutcliffiella deserti]|uniref:ABC transporter substrate-binding protein n=1 Tax=Sutcliffiella deserti TaxID=2875501 RepID=UPI001CBDA6A5|nr:cobalamin-binding protein [Sutcliffiella deserti]